MISLPIGLFGLAGLAVLAALPDRLRGERWALLAFGVPATLMIGNFYDFFMTRYMIVALMPMLALGLTALVTLISAGSVRQKVAVILCAAAIAGLGLNNRTLLVRITEYRGMIRYLRSFADVVKKQNGILLFEYTRIAAPFDHIFGIPTLGIHTVRHSNYERMERAWANIMAAHPGQPAFFITPFQRPFSDRFVFTPEKERTFWGKVLVPRRWDLPVRDTDWSVTLNAYRMSPRGGAAATDALPFAYAFDNGNMGLRAFSTPWQKPWTIEGVETKGAPISVTDPESANELLVFVLKNGAGTNLLATAASKDHAVAARATPLAGEWWLIRFDARELGNSPLSLSFSAPVVVADIVAAKGKRTDSLMRHIDPARKKPVPLESFSARWGGKRAQFCVPMPGGSQGYLMLFQLLPDEAGNEAHFSLVSSKTRLGPVMTLPTAKWHWCVFPLKEKGDGVLWLSPRLQEIKSDQPVALIGYSVVLP
jgi:hypothetical protein